jgi:hypothetical protein
LPSLISRRLSFHDIALSAPIIYATILWFESQPTLHASAYCRPYSVSYSMAAQCVIPMFKAIHSFIIMCHRQADNDSDHAHGPCSTRIHEPRPDLKSYPRRACRPRVSERSRGKPHQPTSGCRATAPLVRSPEAIEDGKEQVAVLTEDSARPASSPPRTPIAVVRPTPRLALSTRAA